LEPAQLAFADIAVGHHHIVADTLLVAFVVAGVRKSAAQRSIAAKIKLK
jgi:hypothetical protein